MTNLVKMAPKIELFDERSPNEIDWAKNNVPAETLNKARHLHAVTQDTIERRHAQSKETSRLSDSIRSVKKQISDIDRYAQFGGKLEAADIKERAELVAELEELQQKANELRQQANEPSLVYGVEKFWQLYEDNPRATYKRKAGDYKGGNIPAALQSGLLTVRKKIAAKEAERQSALGTDLPLKDQLASLEKNDGLVG